VDHPQIIRISLSGQSLVPLQTSNDHHIGVVKTGFWGGQNMHKIYLKSYHDTNVEFMNRCLVLLSAFKPFGNHFLGHCESYYGSSIIDFTTMG